MHVPVYWNKRQRSHIHHVCPISEQMNLPRELRFLLLFSFLKASPAKYSGGKCLSQSAISKCDSSLRRRPWTDHWRKGRASKYWFLSHSRRARSWPDHWTPLQGGRLGTGNIYRPLTKSSMDTPKEKQQYGIIPRRTILHYNSTSITFSATKATSKLV